MKGQKVVRTVITHRMLVVLAIDLFLLLNLSLAFAPSSIGKQGKQFSFRSVSSAARIPSWRHSLTTAPPDKGYQKPASLAKNAALFLQEQDNSPLSSLLPSFASPLDRPILAVLDLLSLLVFAAIGKASHAADGSIDILSVLVTAFPFVLSWFITSPLTGVYSKDNVAENDLVWGTFQTAIKGWIFAIPLGCYLRGVIKGYAPPVPFVIVTMISTLVIIGGVRVAFALAEDFFSKLFK